MIQYLYQSISGRKISMNDNSDFLFNDDKEASLFINSEEHESKPAQHEGTWRIMVVDDEPEVHRITRLVLSKFRFERLIVMLLQLC